MVAEVLKKINEILLVKFQENLRGLIIYGSWVKGTTRDDSDIDLLAIFQKIDREVLSSLSEVEGVFDYRTITIILWILEDFEKEIAAGLLERFFIRCSRSLFCSF